MKCPVCNNVNLVMSERQGIEVDYCPDCRGVWLDRGELDKIIERAASVAPAPPQQQAQQPPQQPGYGAGPVPGYGQGRGDAYGPGHGHGHSHKPYRKKSFLEELFD